MNAAAFKRRFGPPAITAPSWLTWIRSEDLIREKERPKGFTQKVEGSRGSRRVMWPATPFHLSACVVFLLGSIGYWGRGDVPSSKPYLPKMRNAAASRPLRYSRSACLSLNSGGLGMDILTLGSEWAPLVAILLVMLL